MSARIRQKITEEKGVADTLFDSMLVHNDLGEVGDMVKDENGQRWVRLEGDFNLDAIAHELAAYLLRENPTRDTAHKEDQNG